MWTTSFAFIAKIFASRNVCLLFWKKSRTWKCFMCRLWWLWCHLTVSVACWFDCICMSFDKIASVVRLMAIWGSIKILFFSLDFVDNCDNNELVFQIIDCICWVDLNGYNSTSSQKYKYNFIIYYHEHDSRMTFNSPINWSFLQCLFGFSTVLFAFSFSVPSWKTHKTQKEPKKSRNNNNPISTLFIE